MTTATETAEAPRYRVRYHNGKTSRWYVSRQSAVEVLCRKGGELETMPA